MSIKIIIIRPEPFASFSAKKIIHAGHIPVLIPLSTIIDTNNQIPQNKYSGIMLTSATALYILNKRSIVSRFLNLPCYCVGNTTATAAYKAGFRNVVMIESNVKNLCNKIESIYKTDNYRNKVVLYPSAKDIVLKPNSLVNMGYVKFERVIIYKINLISSLNTRKLAIVDSIGKGMVFLYSLRTAKHYFKIFPPTLAKKFLYIAISKRVADTIPDWLPENQIKTSFNTNENAMIKTIDKFISNSNINNYQDKI